MSLHDPRLTAQMAAQQIAESLLVAHYTVGHQQAYHDNRAREAFARLTRAMEALPWPSTTDT